MSSCPLQRSLGRIKYGTHYLNRHWRVCIIVHSASCYWPLHLCVTYGCWSVRIKISVRYITINSSALKSKKRDLFFNALGDANKYVIYEIQQVKKTAVFQVFLYFLMCNCKTFPIIQSNFFCSNCDPSGTDQHGINTNS